MTPAEAAQAALDLINAQPPEVARYARTILRRQLVQETCAHYYADASGGFGWPSCVKCGKPVPAEEAHYVLRPCCNTRVGEDHLAWCASVDARMKRRQLR